MVLQGSICVNLLLQVLLEIRFARVEPLERDEALRKIASCAAHLSKASTFDELAHRESVFQAVLNNTHAS